MTSASIPPRETRPLVCADINARNKQLFLDAPVGGVGSAFNLYGGLRLSAFDDRYNFSISGTERAGV